ncbi:ABC transporter substrate-binding protein [Nocardiopsis exhalans]|uniref:ABC transporter substrate-binding protein n=1 Tax=Nocardiopsis exhalans TaxID=163604 RepID=A0ABY5D237_9ACTN|nr:ABC transporter substrate-binding protein [Nocardiopsis exhalans]USY18409.1 ABC transporter substrate-binding protein [Nocardiopsis exhalans]
MSTEPDCLDPQVSPFDVTALIDRNIFDSLVAQDTDGMFHPWLARSWDVSDDGLTYTFHLRPDVTFHDGTPLDAAAVRETFEYAVDPETHSAYAGSLIRSYQEAEVLDDLTLRVTLSRTDGSFLQALSTAYLGIQSPDSLRDNAGALCVTPIGSGPFTFEEWNRGANVVLRRNPDYQWGPATAEHSGPAELETLDVYFVEESSVRFGMLTSGQVDVAADLPPAKAAQLRSGNHHSLLTSEAPGAVYSLFLNHAEGPLSDVRVREALMRSIRMDELVDAVYFGEYERSWSFLSPATPGHDGSLRGTWEHDPDAVAELLDEAGWTGRDAEGYRTRHGERLTLDWPYAPPLMREEREVLGQGIQNDARLAGIEIRFRAEDPGTYIDRVLGRDADIFAASFVRADPGLLGYYFSSDQTSDQGGSNFFHVQDQHIDRWLVDGARGGTEAEEAYALVQRRVIEEALVIPTYAHIPMVGVTDEVRGLTFDPQAYPLFYSAGWAG